MSPPTDGPSRQAQQSGGQPSPDRPLHEPPIATLDNLRAAAFTLPLDDQLSLAQDLMENAHPPDPEWEAQLELELERTVVDIKAGRDRPVPGEHVFAELRLRHLRPSLSVLLYEEQGVNHAHAVELGLAATGETVGAALVELSNVVLEHYAAAEAQHDPSRLSFDARPDMVRRHARARRRILRREAPDGDRITTVEMPSDKDIAKRAASRRNSGELGEGVAKHQG